MWRWGGGGGFGMVEGGRVGRGCWEAAWQKRALGVLGLGLR